MNAVGVNALAHLSRQLASGGQYQGAGITLRMTLIGQPLK
jgi:hypothetical protein